MGALEGASR